MMRNLTVLFCVMANVCIGQYQGDSWAKVKSSGGKLTVVYYEQPGLIYRDDTGKIRGVCVDILSDFQKYVQSKYGKSLTIDYAGEEKDFSGFLRIIQKTPNILGVTNTSITEERRKVMKFTPPFMSTQLVMLTNKNSASLKDLSEISRVFEGYSAQVISGSTHVQYINRIKKEHFPALNISYATSSESVVQNLSKNTRLFSILDFTEYIGIVRKKVPVKRQEIDLGEAEPLGFVMSRQSDWDEIWNEFLTDEYRKSVRFKEIIATNLGASFLTLVR